MLHATCDDLFDVLTVTLKEFNMNLKDCTGVGSDGTSVMVGVKNSLWTRSKACNPDVIQTSGCICHISVIHCHWQLKKAFDHLPSSLGFLLVEVPKWFQESNISQHEFVELFNTMNADDERKGIPLPFQKLTQTRWLVRDKVLGNILANWHELIAYFSCIEPNCDTKHRYKVRQIKGMLADPSLFWYTHFALLTVTEFE